MLDCGITGTSASRCSHRGAGPFRLMARISTAIPDRFEIIEAFPLISLIGVFRVPGGGRLIPLSQSPLRPGRNRQPEQASSPALMARAQVGPVGSSGGVVIGCG